MFPLSFQENKKDETVKEKSTQPSGSQETVRHDEERTSRLSGSAEDRFRRIYTPRIFQAQGEVMNRREVIAGLTAALAATTLPARSNELTEENIERVLTEAVASGKRLSIKPTRVVFRRDRFFVSERTLVELPHRIPTESGWRSPDIFDALAHEYRQPGSPFRIHNPIFPCHCYAQLGTTREGWQQLVQEQGWDTITIENDFEKAGSHVLFTTSEPRRIE